METSDKGIDYGLGQTNFDPDTGIRYGIIPVHSLADWFYEELEYDYGDPYCPICGKENIPESESDKDYFCADCKQYFWSEECFPESPLELYIDNGQYKIILDERNDVWIFKSPYYTRAAYCSPCAPGACYLLNHTPNGDTAYCLPDTWFNDEKAPYPCFEVKDLNT